MHHKRGRAKNRRAGCLLCKPHKGNGMKGRSDQQTVQWKKAAERTRFQLGDLWLGRHAESSGPRGTEALPQS